MGFSRGFALGDAWGPEVFLEGAALGEALDEAKSYYREGTAVLFDGDLYTVERQGGEDYQPNLDPGRMPKQAHKLSGLGSFDLDEVMRLSAAEAHRRLAPLFRIRILGGPHAGKLVTAYESAAVMKRRFLTANAKLLKGAKGKAGVPPGISRGPNLVPHRLVARLSRKRTLGDVTDKSKLNFCVGSNEACRATCLVYAGNNPVADAQVNIKLARSEALLREPVAWLRMFVEAIGWHVENARKKDLVPYVRPNVLSDIPWERIFPGLFELFPDMWFYDYTKVSGRRGLPPNYDLTFSFSGTNEKQVAFELGRGVRTAVVFWLPKPCSRYKHPCDSPADLTFMGQQVIDGDPHDFRPLDPPGSIIGLSYKVPFVKGKRFPRPPKEAEKFVIPTFRDDDTGALLVAGTPAQLGAGEVFEDSAPTEIEVT